MIKNFKRIILNLALVVVSMLLLSCQMEVKSVDETETTIKKETEQKEKKKLSKNLTLLVTSDIHGGVENGFTLPYVYELKQEIKEKGDHVLLIDNGDLLQGTLLSSHSKGEDLVDIANAAEYDIMTFGNHEFDYGMDQFFKIASKLNTSYISCNFNKEGEPIFDPYVIKEFDGVKFAFIGINTPDCLTTTVPRFFQDANGEFIYGFIGGNDGTAFYNKVQETIDDAKEEGADYIIAVAHVGLKETSGVYKYSDIISHTTGFDVFLDGHSHDTDQVNMKDKDGRNVFRMAVGTKLECIGKVTFTPAGTIEHELLTYELPAEGEEKKVYDNAVSRIIAEKNKAIGDALSEVIGKTDFPLVIYDPKEKDSAGKPIRIVRRMETNLGDLVADAYKVRTGADAAFVNGGGIRVNVEAGDISLLDINTVQPFGNIVHVIEVTGQQILDALEWGCYVTPAESGGFPQVSGMTFDLDTGVPNPCKINDVGMCAGIEGDRRISNLKINGEPVDINGKYTLAILSYTATDHGDGYTAFDGSSIIDVGTQEDYTLIVDYIKEDLNGVIPNTYKDPYGDGRITIK